MKNLLQNLVKEFEFVKCCDAKLRWFDFIVAGVITMIPVIGMYLASLLNNMDINYLALVGMENVMYWCQRILRLFFDYTDNISHLSFNEDVNYYLYFIMAGFVISIPLIYLYGKLRIKNIELQKNFIKKYSRDILSVSIVMMTLYLYQLFIVALGAVGDDIPVASATEMMILFSIPIAIGVLIIRTIIYYTLYKLTAYERT